MRGSLFYNQEIPKFVSGSVVMFLFGVGCYNLCLWNPWEVFVPNVLLCCFLTSHPRMFDTDTPWVMEEVSACS